MRLQGLLRLTLALALGTSVAFPAGAAPPWQRLITFNRVEADRDAEYRLTEDNGPWMIMAVTFLGEAAEKDARDLVFELRKRYKLPAYMYEISLDFSRPVKGRGVDRYGAPKVMKHQRGVKTNEIAVLVGDYRSVDDPEAQRTLKKLKNAKPECLKTAFEVEKDEFLSRPLVTHRTGWQINRKKDDVRRNYGPMGYAFITTNPLLPDEYYVPKGPDKLVLRMNEKVEHCLLDCPGRYSVQVAMFKGGVIQDKRISKENEDLLPDRLADAADKAHRLTVALRKQGYEAFEFHDRYASIVTVGSFDSVGTPRNDGKIEINPQVHAIMETFGTAPPTGLQAAFAAQDGMTTGRPKEIAGIPLDIQPIPVEVPRRTVAGDYQSDP